MSQSSKMEIKKLTKYERKFAEIVFVIEMALFVGALVLSIIRSDLFWSMVVTVIIIGFSLVRVLKGPLTGPGLIEINESTIKFNDLALGRALFNLNDISELRVVGPKKSRRIRDCTKEGVLQDVYTNRWGRRFQRAVEFLRCSIPKDIPLVEEEPPSWAAAIRGDF